jgi:lactate 2-monooxygenase
LSWSSFTSPAAPETNTPSAGDIAAAQAAAETGMPAMFSTLMQDPLEDVIGHAGQTPSFFQLYIPKDRDLAASLVHRARSGRIPRYHSHIGLLDTRLAPPRPLHRKLPQLWGHVLKNYTTDPVFQRLAGSDDPQAIVLTWIQTFGNRLSWADLGWVHSLTDLPIILITALHAAGHGPSVKGM